MMNAAKPRMLALLVTASLATAHAPLHAQIYKTVDEDGNVVYTDQPPTPDAQPITVRELSIVETPEYTVKPIRANPAQANDQGQVTDLGALRRGYRDFKLLSPMPDQSFWGTGNTATVSWDTAYELQEGMSVVVYIDGQAQPATTQPAISTPPLDRGQHQVSAELLDARGRSIASAGPVTFHIKQQSRLINRPGGG